MNKCFKKSFLFLLSLILIFSFHGNVLASTATTNPDALTNLSDNLVKASDSIGGTFASVKPSGEIDLSGVEVTATKTEDGRFIASVPFATASSAEGSITFELYQDATIVNRYSIAYTIVANSLVNGVFGDILIRENTMIFPATYFDQHYSKTFPATTLYYGSVGNVIIPYEEKSVTLRFNNSAMYFLSSGWISGQNYTSTFYVN